MKELVLHYMVAHGYIILFLAFLAELLALPLPGETIMGYIGYLSYQGKMNYAAAFASVYLGVCTGITLSYLIGKKLGNPFFHKYGHYIHLGPERFDRAADWFDRYGYTLILVAYFIPGIRHVTGYFSGTMKTPFRLFAVYAYLGAFLYAGIFITLGRILGPEWDKYQIIIHEYIIAAGTIALLSLLAYYIYRSHKVFRNK